MGHLASRNSPALRPPEWSESSNKERYRVKSKHSLRKSENPNRRDAILTGEGEGLPFPSILPPTPPDC